MSRVAAVPNPFGASLALTIEAPTAATAAPLVLTDALGREVLRQAIDLPAGTSQVALPGLAGLPTGMYVLRLTLGGQPYTVKLVKE